MTDPKHVAEAYCKVARLNYYLVIVDHNRITRDELDSAEQLLIAEQNDCEYGSGNFKTLNLALDLLDRDRQQYYGN